MQRSATSICTKLQQQIVQFINERCINGKPPRGTMKEAREKFNVSASTCTRYWSEATKQRARGETMQVINHRKNKPCSRRIQVDLVLLKSLHYTKRGSIRILAVGLGCSKSTVGRWVQAGLIRAHTSAIKPDLTAPNKLLRMRFTLEALELDRILRKLKFKDMHNTIHIDEKWFYITKGTHRFYMAPEEEEPHRSCKNKQFISKIMFMCAVARPLFGGNGEVLFDGKIGIFPFIERVPAKRNSKNRRAGTIETKPIDSITKQVTKDCVINKVWPSKLTLMLLQLHVTVITSVFNASKLTLLHALNEEFTIQFLYACI